MLEEDGCITPQKKPLDNAIFGAVLAACTPPRRIGNPFNRFFRKKKTSVVVYTIVNGEIGEIACTPTELLNRASTQYHVTGHSPFGKTGTTPRNKGEPHHSLTTLNSQTQLYFIHALVDEKNQVLAVYADTDEDDEHNALFEEVLREVLDKKRTGQKHTKEQEYDSENASGFISVPHRSQNRVMKKKAKDITKKIFDVKAVLTIFNQMDLTKAQKKAILKRLNEFCAEWLHLIDYAKAGKKGQVPENLVYGSKDANTMMMIIEAYTNIKLDKNEKIKITVSAEDIQEDVPERIVIQIEKENAPKCLRIVIDPLGNTKPILQSIEYFQLQQSILEKKAAFSQ